ncbi:MAG TPA: class I SAM-dependent methyltransferase [Solirubrobacteraceae bacterium]|nr:class I SAM-dependent methyltransferase [Solirubrobacteraceae bacterium]
MNAPALEVYGRALQDASRSPCWPPLRLVDAGGRELGQVPLDRYLGQPGAEERALLLRLPPPVLDVGCGPGRHVLALTELGIDALGIDVAPLAVALARRRGADVVRASVFGAVPRAGRWGSALLLDGNVGIGADPTALLRRVAALVLPGGVIAVEVEARPVPATQVPVRLCAGPAASEWFRWGRLDVAGLDALALRAGLRISARSRVGARCFAELRTPGR